jgi:hypothetical protein
VNGIADLELVRDNKRGRVLYLAVKYLQRGREVIMIGR